MTLDEALALSDELRAERVEVQRRADHDAMDEFVALRRELRREREGGSSSRRGWKRSSTSRRWHMVWCRK